MNRKPATRASAAETTTRSRERRRLALLVFVAFSSLQGCEQVLGLDQPSTPTSGDAADRTSLDASDGGDETNPDGLTVAADRTSVADSNTDIAIGNDANPNGVTGDGNRTSVADTNADTAAPDDVSADAVTGDGDATNAVDADTDIPHVTESGAIDASVDPGPDAITDRGPDYDATGVEVMVDEQDGGADTTIVEAFVDGGCCDGVADGIVAPVDPNWSDTGAPFDGIIAGSDTNGAPIMPCRANFRGGVQVGKTRADWNDCDISYNGGEFPVKPYETLVAAWTDEANGAVPSNALAFGTDGSGGPTLYPCRGYVNGNGYQLGKIRPGFTGCLIPFGGAETDASRYQVLTSTRLPLVTQSVTSGPLPAGALVGGYDADGAPLYVCQAMFNGGLVPGKTRSNWSNCDISFAGQEHAVTDYNVILPNFTAPGAFFRAGTDSSGSALGICRASYRNSEQVGKYLSAGGFCNFSFDLIEVALMSGYEVLSF